MQIYCLDIPYDLNSSYQKGSAAGPDAIKAAFFNDSTNTFSENGIEVSSLISFSQGNRILSFEPDIEALVAQKLEMGHKVISLGGDHSITYPIVKAFARAYQKLQVVVLDAHPDLYADFEGNFYSHASPFARIMEQKLATKITQIGIRTANQHQKEQAIKYQVHVVPMNLFDDHLTLNIDGPVYLSIDLDVLDPAFAPGVSHPEPGGMSTRQLINFIQNNGHLNIVGADIVECNPARDLNDHTAKVGAKILKELASIMAK